MSLSAIRTIPLDSALVPVFLEDIINKKIVGAALNALENFIDWLCSWIYYPYIKLYNGKKARIHTFSDNITPLVDSTKQGVAKIDFEWDKDYISLNRIKVLLSANIHINVTFSKKAHTAYVLVLDDEKRRPGWYQIIEEELPRPSNLNPMEKSWWINTNKIHYVNQNPFFLAETPVAIR